MRRSGTDPESIRLVGENGMDFMYVQLLHHGAKRGALDWHPRFAKAVELFSRISIRVC